MDAQIEIFPAFLTFKIIVKNRDGPQISHKFVKEQFYDFMIESDMIRNVLPGDRTADKSAKMDEPVADMEINVIQRFLPQYGWLVTTLLGNSKMVFYLCLGKEEHIFF